MEAETKYTPYKKVPLLILGLIIGLMSIWSLGLQYPNNYHQDFITTSQVNADQDNGTQLIKSKGNGDQDRHYNFLTSFILLEAKCHKKESVEEASSNSAYVRISDLFKVLR